MSENPSTAAAPETAKKARRITPGASSGADAAKSRRVIFGATLATMRPGASAYGRIDDGALAVSEGRIVWVGPQEDLPGRFAEWPREDVEHRLVTPSLVDCHTHLLFAGSRVDEFERRLLGASYEEIARAGGGILSTVRATREATEGDLLDAGKLRLSHLCVEGVGTVEIKSGYGLDVDTELKMLRVARRLGTEIPGLHIRTTLLAAHAVPPEFSGRADDYVALVTNEVLPQACAEGLVDQVDVFSETIAFDLQQTERIFAAARALDLGIRVHAEQLSSSGAARLAARYGARSADHLEYLDPDDAPVLAQRGTAAVLLPGAFYTLREAQAPPIQALREAGVAMAVATDWNPGSSPLASLLLAMNMACTLFRLTAEEALVGTTRVAARVLGLEDELGTLEIGKAADLLVWNLTDPAELSYRIGGHSSPRRMHAGRWQSPGAPTEASNPARSGPTP